MVLNGWRRWFLRRSPPSRKSRSFRPLHEVLEDRRPMAAFVVNSAGDDPDGNYLAPYNDHIGDTGHFPIFDGDGNLVGFTPFSGLCTLRAAIQQANADGVPATITFDPTVTTIFTAGLPIISVPVVIDGTNVAGKPGVELVGGGGNGLALVAGGSTVKGMVIHSFAGAGIALSGGGRNVIQNNYLGTDVTGTVALPVATFTDTSLQVVTGDFTATIDWGDRTAPSPGTVSLSGRTFFVTSSHTFRRTGKYKVTVTIRDEGGSVVTSVSRVHVLRGVRGRSRRKPTRELEGFVKTKRR
jgi:CSLREA domain-containing protein